MTSLPGFPGLHPDVLRWVTGAVGCGATVRSVRRLPGATSSTLHCIELATNTGALKLVLRRFTNADWLAEEPDLALHEATSLETVRGAGVPAPELVACDAHGEHCGVPAVLMTLLPGSVDLAPRDFDGWLRQLAEPLPLIHGLDPEVEGFPWRYAPYNDVARLEPPGWSEVPKLWERAIELVNGPAPAARACFIHRDYHPTNVLWQAGRLSGIVDWPNACRGPAGIDLAWCRGNLAGLYGVDAADRFLQAHRDLAGASSEYHPHWDLMVIIEGLPGPPAAYDGWRAFGIRDITDALARERVDDYLVSVMARL